MTTQITPLIRPSARAAAVLAGLAAALLAPRARGQGLETPGFATLDRQDAVSKLGVDVGVTILDDDVGGIPVGDHEAARLDLYGQFVGRPGFGGYAGLPMSRLFIDGAEDESAIGNLEVGGHYVALADSADIVLRGGLALPTADDGFLESLSNQIATASRLTDFVLTVPETTWLRLSGSPVVRSGRGFFRADVGVDIPIDSDVGADSLFRINLAGGLELESVSLMAELAGLLDAEDTDSDDELFTGALTARFDAGQVQPSISVVLPIDDAVRDVVELSVVAGLQVLLDR